MGTEPFPRTARRMPSIVTTQPRDTTSPTVNNYPDLRALAKRKQQWELLRINWLKRRREVTANVLINCCKKGRKYRKRGEKNHRKCYQTKTTECSFNDNHRVSTCECCSYWVKLCVVFSAMVMVNFSWKQAAEKPKGIEAERGGGRSWKRNT